MSTEGIGAKAEERWEHVGLECCTVRNPFGGLNAYVRLPEPFRARKLTYDDISYEEVDVSGGLTYGMDEAGWVGWDTLHGGDRWHAPDEIRESMRESLCFDEPGRTWTPERVKAENDRLAEQLAAWCERHPDHSGTHTPEEKFEESRARSREMGRLIEGGMSTDEAVERVFGDAPASPPLTETEASE